MRHFAITLTGLQPLIMHHDDIEWADQMEAWKLQGENAKKSKAGDDRSPAFRWIGALYHDGERLVIPSENIMRALMEGGAMVLVPGGKRGKTFKAQSQSGILPRERAWPLTVSGQEVPFGPIRDLMEEMDFAVHKERVLDLGFQLFVKRAKIGTSKHIRVRPMFHEWQATGQVTVIDDQITDEALVSILTAAGRHKGLCDWRPSSRTPGTYGTFEAAVERLK